LERSPVNEFSDVFEGADIVYFIAGAGGKPGEDGEAAEERTKKVDYEGALKVFDALDAVKGTKPRLVLVSALDVRDPEKIPDHYDDSDRAVSERMRKAIPHYMHWKYEADKILVKRTGFQWTIVRPGGLTDSDATGRAAVGRTHLGNSISRGNVAKVLYLLASRPKAAGLAIDICGGEGDIESQLDDFIKKGITDFLG